MFRAQNTPHVRGERPALPHVPAVDGRRPQVVRGMAPVFDRVRVLRSPYRGERTALEEVAQSPDRSITLKLGDNLLQRHPVSVDTRSHFLFAILVHYEPTVRQSGRRARPGRRVRRVYSCVQLCKSASVHYEQTLRTLCPAREEDAAIV